MGQEAMKLFESELPPSQGVYIPQTHLRRSVETLSPNPGAEIVRYTRSKQGVIALGQGQGDSPTPAFICRAAEQAMTEGKTFYDSVLGIDPLRRELSDYYQRIYNLSLTPNRFAVTSSGTTAMHLAFTALLDKDDELVVITPIWRNLLSAAELAEAKVKEVSLDHADGKWQLDLEKLFAAVTDKTRVLLINSPSNPGGWVMPREQIGQVMDFARERGIWIISDEVYSRLTYDTPHAPSFLEFAGEDDRLFVVNSFSKAWAMTGWRLGWLVMPACAEKHICDIALYNNMGPPTFTQYGGIAALRDGEEFIAKQMDLWRGNRDYIAQRFAKIDRIEAQMPEAAFYSFFRVDGEDDCVALSRRLIDEAGVSLAPGCGFGEKGKGFVRLCFAVSRPRLENAINRLEYALR
jgi:aspartate/methionine/tyrosine aminotransferase